ncbi:basic 7S globulin-like [Panicum miliaceum]|uniref:Basic 7S globulin-like n=1 Tax=Panicum miliaceum TaxID=4540 RepID=A0A3L6Q572_PANMI|nr:basic 7S globulin-like [Panicum miliaceum]
MSPHGSSSSPALPLLVLSLLLLSPPGTLAGGDGSPPSRPIVTPITKDSVTSLYTIPVTGGAPLVLDLAGPLIWSPCQPGHRTVPCKSSVCTVANRNHPANCASTGTGQPGSPDPSCACTAYPYNPVSDQCGSGDLTKMSLSANATDGKNPLFPVSFPAYAACAPDGLLASLPAGAAGVAGLSRQPLSLPSQVASRLKVAKQFALCLAGDGQTGATIFGGGPFELQAAPPMELAEDLRKNALPLLVNPKNNGAYYFRVHGIAVNQAQVPMPAGAFDLDRRQGTGGVLFSTVTRYTTLRSDIFSPLINAFDAATSGIPRRKPMPPYNLCYEASAFGSTRLGPGVANIDLMLDGGRNWTLPGASSLVQVDERTLCFAFQNMGFGATVANSPAVIIGTYQMENNLVLFDLEKGTFGISGLLLGIRTTCGNFNFAMGSS